VFPIQKHEFSAGCTSGWAAQLRAGRWAALKGGQASNRTERAAEKGRVAHKCELQKRAGRSIPGQIASKIITFASFRRSSRYTKWRTVRWKGGLR